MFSTKVATVLALYAMCICLLLMVIFQDIGPAYSSFRNESESYSWIVVYSQLYNIPIENKTLEIMEASLLEKQADYNTAFNELYLPIALCIALSFILGRVTEKKRDITLKEERTINTTNT